MYVITFYSFKGGVGRTMALVNVAAELVRRGRRVLVVDFDLEAPGLETYKHLQPPKPHPGIVEYIAEYRRTNAVPNLLDFIYETEPIGKKGGRLWVMPAGRRDLAYRRCLAKLDWQRLYKDEEGFLLFEDTKLGWAEELKPDYVLIDSRTGDTEVLGICTRQLPDSVVLMFTPNEQNLAGLENVVRDIVRERTEGLRKHIRMHFVAANVPDVDDEHRILERQLQRFQKRLGYYDCAAVIPRYDNMALLDQPVFVLDRPHSKLAKAYFRLMRRLIKRNPADRYGALLFLRAYARRTLGTPKSDSRSALNQMLEDQQEERLFPNFGSDLDPSISDVHRSDFDPSIDTALNAKNPLNEIAEHFLDDAEVLYKIAECRILEGHFDIACRVLDRVLLLRADLPDSLYWRALCKINLGKLKLAAEDLLAYLRLPDQPNRVAALRKLAAIAPGQLWQAVDALSSHDVNGIEKAGVAAVLSTTEEGIPLATQVVREFLSSPTNKKRHYFSVETLLRARCWREAIETLERTQGNPDELFQRALAYWGECGAMPKALCEQALQRSKAAAGEPYELTSEAKSWLLWRVGSVSEAVGILNELEQKLQREIDVFSLWHQRKVAVDQYVEDLSLVRRMFQGEPLRPAFLGPAPP